MQLKTSRMPAGRFSMSPLSLGASAAALSLAIILATPDPVLAKV